MESVPLRPNPTLKLPGFPNDRKARIYHVLQSTHVVLPWMAVLSRSPISPLNRSAPGAPVVI